MTYSASRLAAAALAAVIIACPAPGGAQQATPAPAPAAPQVAPVSVAVAEASRGTIRVWMPAEGTAQAVRREILHFGRSGRVVELGQEADGGRLREGSTVTGPRNGEPGQLIARLDQRDQTEQTAAQLAQEEAARKRVEAARGSVQEARAQLAQAEQALARTRDLASKGIVPRKQLDDAEGARATAQAQVTRALGSLAAAEAEAEAAQSQTAEVRLRMEQSELRAPFDGLISFMNVTAGDYVSPLPAGGLEPGQLMRRAAAVVIDPSEYEILVEVPSYQGLALKRGLDAQVAWGGAGLFAEIDRADAAAGAAATGAGAADAVARLPVARAEVFAVAPAIAPDSRTIRLRLRTTDGAEHMRDGLYVSARIMVAERPDVVRVPVQAVRFEGGAAYVFVVEDGVARRKPVTQGVGDFVLTEIADGLSGGETVVVAGQEQLTDGAPVRVIGSGS